MIPRLRPRIGAMELAALLVPASRHAVPDFERGFATLMGQREAVMFPYGRTGLWALLKSLGLSGTEVICPAYTCVVVPHAIVTSGNEPVFVDSREYDFNMDLDQAESAITDKTSVLIATSIFGYPVDLDRLAEIQRKHPDLIIIQDCAHSFAAAHKGRPVQREGRAAIFGLNISKTITSIFGGMVTTDDHELAERLRHTRSTELEPGTMLKSLKRRLYLAMAAPSLWPPIYGVVNRLERRGALNIVTQYYDDAIIDMPSDYRVRSVPIEAAIGLEQLGRYESIVRNRRQCAAFYDEALRDVPGIDLPPLVEGATYSHYVACVPDRQSFLEFGLRHGVQFGQLIEYCCPEMKAYATREGSRHACPAARRFSRCTVNLPVWLKKDPDRGRVAEIASNCLSSAR